MNRWHQAAITHIPNSYNRVHVGHALPALASNSPTPDPQKHIHADPGVSQVLWTASDPCS
ncbi:hypothetical protein ACFFX0_10150 [Citricoccus parietis]|uniref:Methionyl/Leucyl tRNA synthetase domain-containing protein n=1 Tax=Citricoccus parietis TaxID=592307 RepID=A0ABV5FXY4_9MICC